MKNASDIDITKAVEDGIGENLPFGQAMDRVFEKIHGRKPVMRDEGDDQLIRHIKEIGHPIYEKLNKVDPLDDQIEQAYYKHAAGTQINIMDIGKLFADVKAAVGSGAALEASVMAAIQKYKAPEHSACLPDDKRAAGAREYGSEVKNSTAEKLALDVLQKLGINHNDPKAGRVTSSMVEKALDEMGEPASVYYDVKKMLRNILGYEIMNAIPEDRAAAGRAQYGSERKNVSARDTIYKMVAAGKSEAEILEAMVEGASMTGSAFTAGEVREIIKTVKEQGAGDRTNAAGGYLTEEQEQEVAALDAKYDFEEYEVAKKNGKMVVAYKRKGGKGLWEYAELKNDNNAITGEDPKIVAAIKKLLAEGGWSDDKIIKTVAAEFNVPIDAIADTMGPIVGRDLQNAQPATAEDRRAQGQAAFGSKKNVDSAGKALTVGDRVSTPGGAGKIKEITGVSPNGEVTDVKVALDNGEIASCSAMFAIRI